MGHKENKFPRLRSCLVKKPGFETKSSFWKLFKAAHNIKFSMRIILKGVCCGGDKMRKVNSIRNGANMVIPETPFSSLS